MTNWKTVIRRAYNDDGSLFFPEKLTQEFLESAKRAMGSYWFSNQYLNEIIPADLQTFKREWFRYYAEIPKRLNTYTFIDPALSEAATSDFTGIVTVHVDVNGDWFVSYAKRHRLTPTELVDFVFRLDEEFKPKLIGIEEIAFQRALLYFISEEMRRRGKSVPIKGIKYPPQISKETKILSLVPRLEFGHILFNRGLEDLELELLQFPRGSHDDLIDALASIDSLVSVPDNKPDLIKKPHSPSDPAYESWFIQESLRRSNGETSRTSDI